MPETPRAQLIHIDVDRRTPYRIVGSMQDLGTVMGPHHSLTSEGNALSDWYTADYYGRSDGANPKGPERGATRVIRGGSWNERPEELRVTNRAQNGRAVVRPQADHAGDVCLIDQRI